MGCSAAHLSIDLGLASVSQVGFAVREVVKLVKLAWCLNVKVAFIASSLHVHHHSRD